MNSFTVSGQIVDLLNERIYPGTIRVESGKIASIQPEQVKSTHYLLPGFIDAHIHIESSMLIPSEFARLATVHGTVATVSDPHEIANVLGIEGIRYMIQNGNQVPFHFYFGASSCVPATNFETSGASISKEDIQQLFQEDHLCYLSEVMNFPGVIQRDPLVMDKIAIAKQYHKPIDGHAPGLKGKQAESYISAGISTDHECFTLEEALDKIRFGMKILIREGSAAKNYEALHPLLKMHPEKVMFCSDDKHPHELVKGHIDELVRRSIVDNGYDTMEVLRSACYYPVEHYHLDVGLLRPGDWADFIIVNNLKDLRVLSTYIKGILVAQNGVSLIKRIQAPILNHFNCHPKQITDFRLKASPGKIKVIQAIEGQLITNELVMEPKIENGEFVSDASRDLLKIVVINRYQDAPIAIGFIHQFGLKEGAIASCIAHDSHNIICVGVSDDALCAAVNLIIQHKGGIAAVSKTQEMVLPLPVAGIMSIEEGNKIAEDYVRIDQFAKDLGTTLQAPFMTLSFMALLVIPSLKMSDKGLFDGDKFELTHLVTPNILRTDTKEL